MLRSRKRAFCRNAGIKIMAWGPNLLTVEAKSHDGAEQIASQLGQLGFKAIPDEDDAYAGMLSLSKNPSAIQTKIVSLDIARRRWVEQIEPFEMRHRRDLQHDFDKGHEEHGASAP